MNASEPPGSSAEPLDPLESITAAVQSHTGQRFLDELVARLTQTLGVAYAFVARHSRSNPAFAQTVSVAHDGGPVGALLYPLDGTPCGDVLEGGACLLATQARERYPRDTALVEMGVDSYAGVLLSFDERRISGWLAVMHTAPIADVPRLERVLRALGPRVSVELERLDVEAVLWEAHRSLEQRVAERTREIEEANRRLEEEVAQHKQTEEALRASEEKFASAFRCSPDAMVISCLETAHLLEVNDSFLHMTGFTREEVLGRTALDLRFWVHAAERDALSRALDAGQPVRNMEFEFRVKSGAHHVGLLSAENIRIGGDPCSVAVISDITDFKRSEERLVHNAFHDALTDLPNRALFMDRLGHAVDRAKRRKGYTFGVLFLDVDRFKVVNDSLGHRAGDELLTGIARRLESCLRPGDTVARLGGDEFVVLLEDVEDASDATRVAERIQTALNAPFVAGGQEIFATACLGLALSGRADDDPENLVRDADIAMYRAKAKGRSRCEVFDRAMHERVVSLLQLETDLRRAVERGELFLGYQPLVALRSGAVVGFEALVRWRHPERGTIMPADFIPLAEDTGLIADIGRWVLREACRQTRLWHAATDHRPAIAVNLSSRQFLQPDLAAQVEDVLAETRLDARYVHLEITESTVMETGELVMPALARLRDLRVHLCLDDFGTGYSSLSYLHEFPFDTLKIDRSFVGRMGRSGENVEIVRTIVALGHNLHKRVVAEGVETGEQLAQLVALQCEYGQGHYFAEALPVEAAFRLLEERGTSTCR